MTDIRRDPSTSRRSPHAVRSAMFNRRMRGIDEAEVREFLSSLADEIEVADAERAALRAEVERLRREQQKAGGGSRTDINSNAVVLFSQAQQVADRLVAEAVQHARDLMSTAREQQRDILRKAHAAAELAAAKAAEAESAVPPPPSPVPLPSGEELVQHYDRPIPEVEYVRTFARVAQVQLKSVLDALTEQVEKLGELPELPDDRTTASPSGSSSPSEPSETSSAAAEPPEPRDDPFRR